MPSLAQIESSRLFAFQAWLAEKKDLRFDDYAALWQWSVDDIDTFWICIWEYFDVQANGSNQPVLGLRTMPGAQWFPNASLNYAEHVFLQADANRPAIIARQEDCDTYEVSWEKLRRDVGALAATLKQLGLSRGDRVASYMPNRSETVIAFLACASIGAIWSSCAPDMGVSVVLDRFKQIEPKLLFAVDSYSYNGKQHDRTDVVTQLISGLPSVANVVHVSGPLDVNRDGNGNTDSWSKTLRWDASIEIEAELTFDRVPFAHPLWVVYSSGTTGLPKPIVHSHGGIVITHLKTMALQHDLRPGDRLMFLGGTGWIVWNLQIGALLTGATIVLYDGNPAWPDNKAIWKFIDEQRISLFGCGAAYLINCMKDGLKPKDFAKLDSLRSINATGSPLSEDAYEWVYASVKTNLWLASISGGTDIASGFVACAPSLPVVAGEIQCRELGVAAYAFNEAGQSVVDEVGELVITKPMPSMPVFFWNDKDNKRYLESYFELFPGLWRHGDWIRLSSRGSSVIYGRSDSTINRFGIRMGTAEIYKVVEALPEIRDSLVVDLEFLGRPSSMPLFVVLHEGKTLDEALRSRIATEIRTKASPRHVPDQIHQIQEVPRTLTGKKMEVPIRRLLLGAAAEKVAHADAMANPVSFDFFVRLAKELNHS
jgi:acetoacetyl-CoA synthetase